MAEHAGPYKDELYDATPSPSAGCAADSPQIAQEADAMRTGKLPGSQRVDSVPQVPYLDLPACSMEPFEPDVVLPKFTGLQTDPSKTLGLPPLALAARYNPKTTFIPRLEDCHALWERYTMLDNIRAHSTLVATMAQALAVRAGALRVSACVPEVALAAGLLHDLAKTYTIAHGGNHAQLGAAWVMRETGNAPIARAVLYHVHWPFEDHVDVDEALLENPDLFLVMAVLYADKRVKHDSWATLDERFDDLIARYGVNDFVKERIGMSHAQGKRVEAALARRLDIDLNEYIADSGRLVQRT